MNSIIFPGEIKVVTYPPITQKIEIFHCSDCMFFNNDYCKQYEVPVDEQDGCSNYEMTRGITYGK